VNLSQQNRLIVLFCRTGISLVTTLVSFTIISMRERGRFIEPSVWLCISLGLSVATLVLNMTSTSSTVLRAIGITAGFAGAFFEAVLLNSVMQFFKEGGISLCAFYFLLYLR
jgi:hypothetical protein